MRLKRAIAGGGFSGWVESLAGRGMNLAVACLAAAATAYGDDFTAWAHAADFRLNTTASGAGVAGDVADFPLLLRLDSAVFPFDQAKPDGGDIRFSDGRGAALAYQVERWDAGLKRAEIRIRVPLIEGGSDSGFIRMHWGNAAAGSLSDGKAVFASSLGYASVWHMQGDALKDAAGNAGDADGTRSAKTSGLIADARALLANNEGIVVPNAAALNMSAAITVSAWVRSEPFTGGLHYLLTKGSTDVQYSLAQDAAADSLVWTLGGLTQGGVLKGPLPAAGAWHHVAATYDGTTSRLFVDGSLVKSQGASGPIATATDELCIGCRSASGKPRMSFKGVLDEVTVSGAAQSADFIKLAYANQRAQQVLVLNPALVDCQSSFGVSPETTVTEGAPFVLKATADCATGYGWAALSGPAPRLLDPEVKTLAVTAPRITKDTSVVYRFTARFGESVRNADVTVRIRESIPDPVFTMPAVTGWNGRDSLVLSPSISNLAAVKASGDSVLRFSWTLKGPEADTSLRNGALILRKASLGGLLTVGVCIDNGGPAACRSTAVTIDLAVGLARREGALLPDRQPGRMRDGLGRLRAAAGTSASPASTPVFTRTGGAERSAE